MVKTQSQHPSEIQLAAFSQGRLPESEMAVVEAHVAECSSCCECIRQAPDDKLGLLARAAHGAPAETIILQGPDADTGDAPLSSVPAADSETPAVPPELVDHPRYEILKVIGKGGMGVVFKAEHRMMQRPVALKVINQRYTANKEAIDRFHQEVRTAARLSHPNIVAAFDAEQAGNLHYLVMEFVEGKNLAQWVQQRGPLSVVQACNAIRQVCAGLQCAHERGMTHRDIKPQNLMLAKSGKIKILDFGLARFEREQFAVSPTAATESELTAFGTVLGTPDYMAPEQATDSRLADARSDIFSVGCTLFFLLTGRSPFAAGSFTAMVLTGVQRQMVPLESLRSDLPDGLIAIVTRLMATNPSSRFASVAEVAEALVPFGRGEKTAASSSSRPDEAAPPFLPGMIEGEFAEAAPEPPQPKTRVSKRRRAEAETAVFEAPRAADVTDEIADDVTDEVANPDEEFPYRSGRSRSRRRRSPPSWQTRLRGILQHPGTRIALAAIAVVMLLGIANSWRSTNPEIKSAASNNVPAIDDRSAAPLQDARNEVVEPLNTPQPASTAAPVRTQSRVLMVLAAWNFWWPDYEPMRRRLEAAGVRVTVASWLPEAHPKTGGGGSIVRVDVQLRDVVATDFDAVVFVGGPGVHGMIEEAPQGQQAGRIIKEMLAADRLVTAVCFGPLVLAKAGVLDGIPATGTHYIRDKIASQFRVTLTTNAVERTGNIITGCDDKTIPEFTAELLKALEEKRAK